MALTDFASLTSDKKLVWARWLVKEARDMSFFTRFMGGQEAVIQRVTELTKTERGEEVIIHLLADLVEDGVIGDDQREGFEESLQTYNDKVRIDQLAHQVRNKGKLSDQKSVINFRENARDRLAYWLANRLDQLFVLTASGVSYAQRTDGSLRTSSAFANLAFAADVTAPSANRHRRWDATNGLVAGDTTQVDPADVITYKTLVDMNVYAKTQYMKAINQGGKEYYVVFLRPEALAQLKVDPDYQRAVITGQDRGKDNPFFTGGTVTVDGLILHEHRLVYNTKGAAAGSKWGAGGNVNGSRMLLCGPQAIAFADLGTPEWNEKTFEYGSSQGISVDRMIGMVKPKFHSIYTNTVEDFGVLAVDHAIN